MALTLIGLQRVLELRHFPTIGLDRRWVKLHDVFGSCQSLKLPRQTFLLALEIQQLRSHAGRRDTVCNGINDIVNLPVEAGKSPFSLPAPLPVHSVQPLLLGVILGEEAGNGIRRQQLPLDALQHTLFEITDTDRLVVHAGAFFTVGGAGKLVLVFHRIGGTTAAAPHKP